MVSLKATRRLARADGERIRLLSRRCGLAAATTAAAVADVGGQNVGCATAGPATSIHRKFTAFVVATVKAADSSGCRSFAVAEPKESLKGSKNDAVERISSLSSAAERVSQGVLDRANATEGMVAVVGRGALTVACAAAKGCCKCDRAS